METDFNLITDKDIRIILKGIAYLFAEKGQQYEVGYLFKSLGQKLKNFQENLQVLYTQYQKKINNKLINWNGSIYALYQEVRGVTKRTIAQRLENHLLQGYIILQTIREIMLKETIQYKIFIQNSNKTATKLFTLNLSQFVNLISKTSLNSQNKGSLQVAELEITLTNITDLAKQLHKTDQDPLEEIDSLYKAVLNYQEFQYNHKTQTIKLNALAEVYMQLKSIGYTGEENKDKFRRAVLFFYNLTKSINLNSLQGGDSFLDQIKFGRNFRLIKYNLINDGLSKLINTFNQIADRINEQEVQNSLEEMFIQLTPTIQQFGDTEAAEAYQKALGGLINEEKKALTKNIEIMFS